MPHPRDLSSGIDNGQGVVAEAGSKRPVPLAALEEDARRMSNRPDMRATLREPHPSKRVASSPLPRLPPPTAGQRMPPSRQASPFTHQSPSVSRSFNGSPSPNRPDTLRAELEQSEAKRTRPTTKSADASATGARSNPRDLS